MSGCASEAPIGQIDADAFSKHFAAQRACKKYVAALVGPAAEALSAKKTLGEMRAWLREHSDDEFSKLATRVQALTAVQGSLDPQSKIDQRKVVMLIFKVLSERTDFEGSSCGPDVREFVAESLYLGLGGETSEVAAELHRRGVEGGWEQRWVLLTSLMAGALATVND